MIKREDKEKGNNTIKAYIDAEKRKEQEQEQKNKLKCHRNISGWGHEKRVIKYYWNSSFFLYFIGTCVSHLARVEHVLSPSHKKKGEAFPYGTIF